jgi:hypothetical protein
LDGLEEILEGDLTAFNRELAGKGLEPIRSELRE